MPERMGEIFIQSLKWLLSGGLMRSVDKVTMSPFFKNHLPPRTELFVQTLPSHDGLERHCPEARIRALASPFLNASGKLCRAGAAGCLGSPEVLPAARQVSISANHEVLLQIQVSC